MGTEAALFVAVLVTGMASAQELAIPPVRYPGLPGTATEAGGFTPPRWRIETQAEGDLDGDGRADLAIVMRMNDPANVIRHEGLGNNPFDTNPRILSVAFRRPGGGYRLVVENHVLIPRRNMPTQEDPFGDFSEGMAISRGTLRVSLHRFMNAGGWDAGPMAFTFRWQRGALRLIGYDYANVQRNTGCFTSLSINYLTGRVKTTVGTVQSDEEQVRWSRLRTRRLLTLEEVGDGMEFDADGAIGRLPSCNAGE